MFTVTGVHTSTVGGSSMGSSSYKKTRWTGWWVTGGCICLVVTVTFVATTVYLAEQPTPPTTPPPPTHHYEDYYPSVKHKTTNKATIEMVTLEEARQKEAFEEDFKVPAAGDRDVLPSDGLEEIFEPTWPEAKESPTRKKSEALLPPSGWPEPRLLGEPLVVDPENHFEAEGDFKLPGFGQRMEPSSPTPEGENSLADLAYDRLKDLAGGDWARVLEGSLSVGNVTAALRKIYSEPSGPQQQLNDTSSLASFAMLAVDLFLLHNVQRVALTDDTAPLKSDPEVAALDALFTPKNPQTSRALELTPLQEFVEMVGGFLRAVVTMIKVYNSPAPASHRSAPGPTPLDCLWTLYCRNLDKTAKLDGPYGLLAKVNSFGLRLMMGEFPAESVPEKIVSEVASGWSSMDCGKLFPRCSAEEAKDVVLATARQNNIV